MSVCCGAPPAAASDEPGSGANTRELAPVVDPRAVARDHTVGTSSRTSTYAKSDGTYDNNADSVLQRAMERFPSWQQRAITNSNVEDPVLLRGVRVGKVLRSCAQVLGESKGNAQEHELSTQVDHIDTFLSHTWSTPRYKKFLVLTFHYNLRAALAISFLVAAGASALTVQGFLPVLRPVTIIDTSEDEYSRGVLALPLGLVTFLISLFSLHELDRILPLRRHVVFLDKACVHQTDMELKQRGIRSLAGFLKRSSNMLVLYSEVYMQRLWTIYEVASWLILHHKERITVRPVAAPLMSLCACMFFTFYETAFLLIGLEAPEDPNVVLLLLLAVTMPALTAAVWISGKWAEGREMIQCHIAEFSLADARCVEEADRRLVQSNIVAFMKYSELSDPMATHEEVCNDFETLVRQEVPQLMLSSFGRVGVPYLWAMVLPLPHALVTFDYASGWILDSRPALEITLEFLLYMVVALTVSPLLMAFSIKATENPRFRSLPWCVVVGALINVLILGSHWIFALLGNMAEEEPAWLALLLPIYTVLGFATFLVYRPLP